MAVINSSLRLAREMSRESSGPSSCKSCTVLTKTAAPPICILTARMIKHEQIQIMTMNNSSYRQQEVHEQEHR